MEAATITVESTPVNQKSCLKKVMSAIATYLFTHIHLFYSFTCCSLLVPFLTLHLILNGLDPRCARYEGMERSSPSAACCTFVTRSQHFWGEGTYLQAPWFWVSKGERFLQARMKLRSSGLEVFFRVHKLENNVLSRFEYLTI